MLLAGISGARSIVSLGGRLLSKPSPRYQGGPLVSSVDASMSRIAAGDMTEIDNLFKTSHNPAEKNRVQWLSVWDTLMPQQPLTDAQKAKIVGLDPTKAGILGGKDFVAATGGIPALAQVAEPLRAAAADSAAQLREAAAASAERLGVGGGAALAKSFRGGEGPLDKVIAFAQKPSGLLVAGGVVLTVILVAAFTGGRHSR